MFPIVLQKKKKRKVIGALGATFGMFVIIFV